MSSIAPAANATPAAQAVHAADNVTPTTPETGDHAAALAAAYAAATVTVGQAACAHLRRLGG
jgi:hypothetical protein